MDSIATKAKVSKRTLYKHFPSKRALLDEILIHLISSGHEKIKISYDSSVDIKILWESVIRQKLSNMLDPQHIKLGKIILSELLKNESCLSSNTIEKVLRSEQSVSDFITKAQRDNKISAKHDVYHILDMLQQLINGIIFFPVLFGKKNQASEEDIHFIIECLYSNFS